MKKYCIVTLLLIFTVCFSLFSQELLINNISLLNFENQVTDVFINKDNFAVALPGKLIIYDEKGQKRTKEKDELSKCFPRSG